MINSELISHSLIANERLFIMDLVVIHLGKFKGRVDAKPGPADEDDGLDLVWVSGWKES